LANLDGTQGAVEFLPEAETRAQHNGGKEQTGGKYLGGWDLAHPFRLESSRIGSFGGPSIAILEPLEEMVLFSFMAMVFLEEIVDPCSDAGICRADTFGIGEHIRDDQTQLRQKPWMLSQNRLQLASRFGVVREYLLHHFVLFLETKVPVELIMERK
jgi:hypothetical protein